MTLYDLIVKSSEAGLAIQDKETGVMPSGHNGPYFDAHTPVRNTSHWLLTFIKAYELTGDMRFQDAAEQAVRYLTGSEARPLQATFQHRINPEKDLCNGLIGQAWTIEALVEASRKLNMPELIDLAEEVFLLHPFNEKIGIWKRVATDGMYLPYDMTFNHQLWFAAAGAQLAKEREGDVRKQVDKFMKQLDINFTVYRSGLIYHPLVLRYNWKQKLKNILQTVKKRSEHKQKLMNKAVGYHLFNLYAFAILKIHYPSHRFWSNKKFCRALNYARSAKFRQRLSGNKFSYAYNPPGFEMALTLQVFFDDTLEERQWWVSEQLNRCFDFDCWLMSENTADPNTHAARLYEATRLEDVELKLNKIDG